jgi:hypothetical protein
MRITFKADEIRRALKSELGIRGFEDILRQELDRIVKKHRDAAIKEIQVLAVRVASREDFASMSAELIIETNEEAA